MRFARYPLTLFLDGILPVDVGSIRKNGVNLIFPRGLIGS